MATHIDLKFAAGLAKQDLLSLTISDIHPGWLHAYRSKTQSKGKIHAWDADSGGVR